MKKRQLMEANTEMVQVLDYSEAHFEVVIVKTAPWATKIKAIKI
jgi:hypothetical protein